MLKRMNIEEIEGDLFDCDADRSLAHCVSVDMVMGKGIAVTFREKFGRVSYLVSQGAQVGEMAVIEDEGRYVYYLVTKDRYWNKPTYETLRGSMEAMKVHCIKNGVKKLGMPRIGCGLDCLKCENVKEMIIKEFMDMEIDIRVYYL